MEELTLLGERAVQAKYELQRMTTEKKNEVLEAVAEALIQNTEYLLLENHKDLERGIANQMNPGLVGRLRLTKERIAGMAEGIRQIVKLPDPVGEILDDYEAENGLHIVKKRVPMGVIGIIYESRPNVTADAFALCFKTGNAVILRGGSDAIHSNLAICNVIREALEAVGLPADAIQVLEDTSRETAQEFMRLNQYMDLLIPRGGAGLIRTVVEKSTVPVIETGTGNCHVYVDETADIEMAVNIIVNAKTQRLGVCNACESLVIHEAIAEKAIPEICKALYAHDVEIRGDEISQKYDAKIVPATEEDYGTEYLDRIISMKVVPDIDAAIAHINKYNTGHSESIITKDYESSMRFLNEIDAAAVYVNASTRFTDGFEFGFGAEIGISTQKLHARGPMGLLALTSTKYIILGNGQIRK